MSEKHGRGVILHDSKEPMITGYLIIGDKHYQIVGERMSDIRTNLDIRETFDTEVQEDLFDENTSRSGERKCTSV